MFDKQMALAMLSVCLQFLNLDFSVKKSSPFLICHAVSLFKIQTDYRRPL